MDEAGWITLHDICEVTGCRRSALRPGKPRRVKRWAALGEPVYPWLITEHIWGTEPVPVSVQVDCTHLDWIAEDGPDWLQDLLPAMLRLTQPTLTQTFATPQTHTKKQAFGR